MSEPFAPRVESDRMDGRGAADMKGGLATMVVAASVGSASVISPLPRLGVWPDARVITEPTGLALSRSLRGFAVVRVTFTGRATHSSQAELGVNAVTHPGRLLHAVDRRAPAVRATGGDLMVTWVRRGESPFVVPHRDGWRLDETGPAAELAARLSRTLGTAATFDAPYWMEAPLWQQLCPTLVCGPSGGGLHAVDEWVDLQHVRSVTDAWIEVLAGAD
jgi:acetylornithine deacetylase